MIKQRNWKTTWAAVFEGLVWLLTLLSIIPYDSGFQIIGIAFGQEAREMMIKIGLGAGFLLRILSGKVAADAAGPTVPPAILNPTRLNLLVLSAMLVILFSYGIR